MSSEFDIARFFYTLAMYEGVLKSSRLYPLPSLQKIHQMLKQNIFWKGILAKAFRGDLRCSVW